MPYNFKRSLLSDSLLEVKEQIQEAFQVPEKNILEEFFFLEPDSPVTDSDPPLQLGPSVLQDVEWAQVIQHIARDAPLSGVQHHIQKLFENPEKISHARRQAIQQTLQGLKTPDQNPYAHPLQHVEKDSLWALKAAMDHPLTLLYPTLPILRLANKYDLVLSALHVYKIVLGPLMQIGTPIASIMGPYFLLRRQMGLRIPLKTYLKMVYMMFLQSIKPTYRNMRKDAMKIGSVLFYLLMYIYGLVNTLEYAKTVYDARVRMVERAKGIRAVLQQFLKRYEDYTASQWLPFRLLASPLPTKSDIQELLSTKGDLPFLYKFMSPVHKSTLQTALDYIYAYDTAHHIALYVRKNQWGRVSFTHSLSDPPAEFYGMGHPLLSEKQVRNPARLNESIIMTGPNAAGKSTYARSILVNTLLGLTFGFCVARKATLGPIQVIYSHMRLNDHAGIQSLFEAEVKNCSKILQAVERSRPWSLVFLDEPMHSTNPIEGAAATMGLVKRLSEMAGVRAVVTTHYHQTAQLDTVRHLSVEAIPTPDGFEFPYKLRNGPSTQCIALDLLRERIDDAFLDDAVKIKDRLCKLV